MVLAGPASRGQAEPLAALAAGPQPARLARDAADALSERDAHLLDFDRLDQYVEQLHVVGPHSRRLRLLHQTALAPDVAADGRTHVADLQRVAERRG